MDPLCAAKELAALVEKEAQRLQVPVTFLRYRRLWECHPEAADDRREAHLDRNVVAKSIHGRRARYEDGGHDTLGGAWRATAHARVRRRRPTHRARRWPAAAC
jgi:hypothetical protein